jgi:altronate hydrolase
LAPTLIECVEKAARYYTTLGHGSFAPGNAEGGLTTQEEKSMGAYSKSGHSPIAGILKPGDVPPQSGLYLLDVVPDGEVRWGFPNISDIQEMGELIACGSHLTLFHDGPRLGRWFGDFAGDQDLRESRNLSPDERGHGH